MTEQNWFWLALVGATIAAVVNMSSPNRVITRIILWALVFTVLFFIGNHDFGKVVK